MTVHVVAVCPVYEPPGSTAQRMAEIGCQVADVVVVDDGSHQPVIIPGVQTLRLPTNQGIATALNVGLAAAESAGATHVLTIDQDSSFPEDYLPALLDCWTQAVQQGLRPAAVGALEFSGLRHTGSMRNGVQRVAECIQSGTLFDVDALRTVGGFDEALVIDGVDTDVCLRLQDAGWDICVAPVAFEHRLGEGHFVSLLGRRVWSSNHPPFRRYYITRNGMTLLRRHGRRHLRWALISARRLLVASLLAARSQDQRRAMWNGAGDALRGRLGPRQRRGEATTAR